MINRIVNWMIEKGINLTSEGSYCFYVDEVSEYFGISKEYVRNIEKDIVYGLCEKDETIQCSFESISTHKYLDHFSITFYLGYCKNLDIDIDEEGKKEMIDIKINYETALMLEFYIEKEIKDIKKEYSALSAQYKETCKYNADRKNNRRSFSTDYGITEEYYEERARELCIRQYNIYIKLEQICNGL